RLEARPIRSASSWVAKGPITTRNIGEPAVVVETTWAEFPATLIVFASCCAFSSLSSAANETVNPADGGLAVGAAALVSRTVTVDDEAVLDAVDLKPSASHAVL